MPLDSPLLPLFRAIDAPLLPYGPPASSRPPSPASPGPSHPDAADAAPHAIAIPAAVSYVEAEYAAIRKHAAILDQPQRGTLVITGSAGEGGKHDFLGRMLTQQMRDFAPFTFRRAFWLNRKGRIDADLRLAELGDHLHADLDIFSAAAAVATLSAFIFAEDVQIEDASDRMHRLALHGPAAPGLLSGAAEPVAGPRPMDLAEGQVCVASIGGARVVVERQDSLAAPGFELTMDRTAVEQVWRALAEPLDSAGETTSLARPIGWHAYNIARIEAGWPLFNIDFGPTNLPHETGPAPGGVLRDRVSFTKGCYLGQEIVARMESLGKPKQVLVGLKVEPSAANDSLSGNARPQPATGSRLFREAAPGADLVGAVTSSAISPMLGGVPICFAMVKQAVSAPSTRLYVEAEGQVAPAVVQPSLRFWPQG